MLITNYTYQFEPKIVNVKEFVIYKGSNGISFNCTVEFLENLNIVFTKHVMSTKLSNSKYSKIIDKTSNFCEFSNTAKQNVLVKTLLVNLEKRSNFTVKCPIEKVV